MAKGKYLRTEKHRDLMSIKIKKWHTTHAHPLLGTHRIVWNKGLKTGISSERQKEVARSMCGQKSPSWKGEKAITPILKRIRNSALYKLWRETVFKRDNWTCVLCKKRGEELNADHIKPFSLFPELRFAIDNGRTLCIYCHKNTPTFGVNLLKV